MTILLSEEKTTDTLDKKMHKNRQNASISVSSFFKWAFSHFRSVCDLIGLMWLQGGWLAGSAEGLKCHRTWESSCVGGALGSSTAHSFWEVMLDTKCCHGYLLWALCFISSRSTTCYCDERHLRTQLSHMFEEISIYFPSLCIKKRGSVRLGIDKMHTHTGKHSSFLFPSSVCTEHLGCSCWMPAGGGRCCWGGWEVLAAGQQGGWWGFGRYSCPCRLHGDDWQWKRSTLETEVRG